MRYLKLLPILVLMLCAACADMPKAYVEADEDTYNAVQGPYSAYFENDPTLTEDQKQSKRDVLTTWILRINEAKKGAK